MSSRSIDPRTSAWSDAAGEAHVPHSDVERNRVAWESWARDYAVEARLAWTADELSWGIWNLPERDLRLLESLDGGADVVELGCGAGATAAWLARIGMRPVAVDIARAQIETARKLQLEIGPNFPLIHADAEAVPYDDESFDMALSEYGASLWCDPRRWLPEAHRLLRPGGLLVFMTNSPHLMTCTPIDGGLPTNRLLRDHFTSPRVEFPEDQAVEFHLGHGGWIELLKKTGFVVDRLLEVQPPPGRKPRFPLVSAEWARRWPSEDIWVARKTA